MTEPKKTNAQLQAELDELKQQVASLVAKQGEIKALDVKLTPQPELDAAYQEVRKRFLEHWLPEAVFRGADSRGGDPEKTELVKLVRDQAKRLETLEALVLEKETK